MALPEFYADQFNVTVSPYTVILTLGMNVPPAQPKQGGALEPLQVARVRMSPEMGKVLAMLLKKTLRARERDGNCDINVPANVLNEMGLSSEDWV